PPVDIEDLDAVQPAAWRVALEDVAAQVHRGERLHAPRGERAHRLGMVGAGVNRDHAEIAAGLQQAHRLARHAHADLHFGTDADPFDMRRERLEQRRVALVAAVEPHLVAKQARRDADPNCLHPFSPGGFAPSASARTRATAGSGETSPKPNGEGGPEPPARSLAGTPGPAPFAWLARCARSLMRVPGTS